MLVCKGGIVDTIDLGDENLHQIKQHMFIDSRLKGQSWRWGEDAPTKNRILFVSAELFNMLNSNQIPEKLMEEIRKGSNGDAEVI
jgi:hypothetical protein